MFGEMAQRLKYLLHKQIPGGPGSPSITSAPKAEAESLELSR